MSIEDVVNKLGKGTLLVKIDIESAFRNIPMTGAFWVCMVWEGQLLIDAVFPFGLYSAPKIFNRDVSYLNHYLDGFITCRSLDSTECHQNVSVLIDTCKSLNISRNNYYVTIVVWLKTWL